MPIPPNDPKDAVAHLIELRQRIERLERAATKAPEPADVWHTVGAVGEPGFLNGWSAYGAPFSPVVFKKDSIGRVWLAGLTAKVGGNWNAYENMFILPVGYRPALNLIFNPPAGGGGVSSDYECRINTNGEVQVGGRGASANPVNWASISGISFEGV